MFSKIDCPLKPCNPRQSSRSNFNNKKQQRVDKKLFPSLHMRKHTRVSNQEIVSNTNVPFSGDLWESFGGPRHKQIPYTE